MQRRYVATVIANAPNDDNDKDNHIDHISHIDHIHQIATFIKCSKNSSIS